MDNGHSYQLYLPPWELGTIEYLSTKLFTTLGLGTTKYLISFSYNRYLLTGGMDATPLSVYCSGNWEQVSTQTIYLPLWEQLSTRDIQL